MADIVAWIDARIRPRRERAGRLPGCSADLGAAAGGCCLGKRLAASPCRWRRVAGIALIGLGMACWPGPPKAGMLIYGSAVSLYLAFVGFAGGSARVLLWPAVILHAVLSV